MRGSTWRRALWRIGAAILIAIVLQLASAQSAHAGDARVLASPTLQSMRYAVIRGVL